MKFKFLLSLLFVASFAKADNFFLTQPKIQELKESFKPVLEVPSKFLKFKALWYEGNNRQQIHNVLGKEKIKRLDLQLLIDLLNKEKKRLGYKITVIVDTVNGVISKKFLKELSHLMPIEIIEKEAKNQFISPDKLIEREKLRHQRIIEDILLLMQTLPVHKSVDLIR